MMRTDALQTIELLSLEVKHGRHQLHLAIERNDERHESRLEVDKDTYQQLLPFEPIEGERVRLSFYASWDPFRQVHYSSLVKSNRLRNETHYFTCSEQYADFIEQIRLSALPEITAEDRSQQEASLNHEIPRVRSHTYIAWATRFMVSSLRLLVLTCVLYVSWFELEGSLLMDNRDVVKEHQIPVAATEEIIQDQGSLRSSDHIVQAQGEENGTSTAEGVPEESEGSNKREEAFEQSAAAEVIELADGQPYYSLPEGYVGLTFDDGPSIYTKDIVDQLTTHGVAATFLFVGKNAGKDTESVVYAHEQGMAVGNHSWDHSDMSKLKGDTMASNIAKANEMLEPFIGQPVSLFRPPYGATNDRLSDTVEDLGMKMLLWNRDPNDWRTDEAKDILQYFKQTNASGGIYLLHEKKATLEALPDIIQYLKEQDLKFAIFQ